MSNWTDVAAIALMVIGTMMLSERPGAVRAIAALLICAGIVTACIGPMIPVATSRLELVTSGTP